MSGNTAVAAAQRRRAGTNSNSMSSENVKLGQASKAGEGPPNRTLGLADVLGIQSRQLRFLKDYQEGNERHWEANDEFLHQLSEKVDELSESQGEANGANQKGGEMALIVNRMEALEKEVAQLHGIIASLQDELLQKDQ